MKIRSGFVSNSSSSSFCCLGVQVDNSTDLPWKSETIIDEFYGISDYYDQKFIGADPCQQNDNETLASFKQRIVDEINFHVEGVDAKVSDLCWYTDGGYDG